MQQLCKKTAAQQAKTSADFPIYVLFSFAALVVMRGVYLFIGELSYAYAGAVFGLDGLGRAFATDLAMTAIMMIIIAAAALIIRRILSVRLGLFTLLSVLGLTYCGKIGKTLEYLLDVKPKSSQDVWLVHDRFTMAAFAVSVLLAVFAGIVLNKLERGGYNRKPAVITVTVFGVLTVALNAVCVSHGLSAGWTAMLTLSVAIDALKLAFISVSLLSEKQFNSKKLLPSLGWILLCAGLFVGFYDLGFVPYDLLGRIDGNFFFG